MVFNFNVRQWGSFGAKRFLLAAGLMGHDAEGVSAVLFWIFICRVRGRSAPPWSYAALPYIDNRAAADAAGQKRIRDATRRPLVGAFSGLGFRGKTINRVECRGKCVRGEIRVEAITVNTQRFS